MHPDPAIALKEVSDASSKLITESLQQGDSDIQKFYSNSSIFITGGSGFLGKLLIEKLIRSCPDIKKIFILMRSKKSKTIEERFVDILKDPLFNGLHEEQSKFVDKLVTIPGDISELKLGISDGHWKTLTDEVDVIFHLAATVRFDEPLKKATLFNVRGTREVLTLGKACSKLRSLVHVSTAFSHATQPKVGGDVFEEFYGAPVPPDVMIDMAETMDERRLNDITPQLIKDWPNTYAFTKAIAEDQVRAIGNELPVCVVRPSIVICAYREPAPGWLDMSCAYGPTGFIVAIGLGILHCLHANGDIKIDLIPADIVNNATIAAGRETAIRRQNGQTDAKIYTVTSERNRTSWQLMTSTMLTEGIKYSTNMSVWYCYAIETKCKYLHWILLVFLHYIPAYIIDGVAKIFGKEPRLRDIYKKIDKFSSLQRWFTTNEWKFSDKNTKNMFDSLSTTDKNLFNFDVNCINWRELILIWCIGARLYIIKDGLKNTEKGIKKQFYFRLANYLFCFVYISIWYFLFSYFFRVLGYVFF